VRFFRIDIGMKTKQFFCLALCLSLLFTLAACKTDGDDAAGNNNSVIVVGYAQVGAESVWRIANTKSFEETFSNDPMYDFRLVECQNKADRQIEAVSDFIAQEVDYIVIAAKEESGWDQILIEAKDAGIPVILSDRFIDVADDSLYVAWVGGNFVQEGKDAMMWLNNYLAEVGRENEAMNIFHIQGSIGSSAQIGRTQSITEGIAANPNLILKEQQTGDFTLARGQEVMEEWLQQYDMSEIDILIAENDDMAFGAIKAMEDVGLDPGRDVIVISFDACRAAVQAVIDGKINCTVECNPLHGPRVKEIIETLEAGGTVEKIQYVKETYFDIKNAETELENRY